MNSKIEQPPNMYGISRIDNHKYHTHAWRVSLVRNGRKFVKNFADKKLGGKNQSLLFATQYRDQLVGTYQPLSRQEFCNARRRNNKTGITGVYKYKKSYITKDGQMHHLWYWEANWPTVEGKSAKQTFSVKEFGDETAKQLAIRSRKEGLQKVEGVFWPCKQGAAPKQIEASINLKTTLAA